MAVKRQSNAREKDRHGHPRGSTQDVFTSADATTAEDLIAAPTDGNVLEICALTLSSQVATLITIADDSDTPEVLWRGRFAANTTWEMADGRTLRALTANKKITIQAADAGNIYANFEYYTTPADPQ